MMKKFLLLSGLLVSFSLFGEITQQTILNAIGLPLVGTEQSLTHVDLEKKLQQSGIKFNGSPVKRTAFINGMKILEFYRSRGKFIFRCRPGMAFR